MRIIGAVPLLAVALMLVGGCSSSSNPDVKGRDAGGNPDVKGRGSVGNPDRKGGEGSNFAARYDAACAITVFAERDAALSKLAEDAAQAGQAGNVEIVQKCLGQISTFAVKDDAAYKAALTLAKAGNGEIVQKCLDQINIFDVRDDAACKAALSLAKAGNAKAGVEVAKSIRVVSRRDEVLGKLARGEYDQ
jgi:hypothetical protein